MGKLFKHLPHRWRAARNLHQKATKSRTKTANILAGFFRGITMHRIPVRWSALIGVFLLFTLPGAWAQSGNSQQSPAAQSDTNPAFQSKNVIRANTRLVVLDVVAVDDKGQPITGLTAEDFTAMEDGKQQRISDFSFHHPGKPAPAGQLPPDVVSNAFAYTSNSSLNIILLDAINTDFSSHAYAQEMLIKYLETGPVIQPTAVFALEGKLELLHDFTTDTQVLKDVLAHFRPQGPEHIPDVYTAASPFGHQGSFKASPNARQVTFSAMLYLARSLTGYPGRKNLIWLSEGFPLNLFPDALMGDGAVAIEDYSPLVEKIADELMNAQVAVYPIDAAGVTQNDRFSARTAMESVAQRTGGKTFFNRNDIDLGIRNSIDDGSTYYTLEYYPDNKKWDSKFRHIELKIDRPGAKLRYREGYYALGPDTQSADPAADFSRALDLNAPASTAVLFQAHAVVPKEKGQKVQVQFHIDPHTLAFDRQADDLQHAGITCVVWAYPGKGAPIRSEGEANAALVPDVFKQVMQSYYPCQRTIDLKPGRYTLRLGVLDHTTNHMGSTSMQLTVP
jgi:VWFA-related protein